MDLDGFKFDKFIIRDIMVLDTSIAYFDEGMFGRLELKRDIYHHFRSYVEWTKVREACRSKGGSNGELMVDYLMEVNYVL